MRYRRWMRLVVVAVIACGSAAAADPLVIGEFKVAKIVDGDTIRVDGLDHSLRILGIDTEETFKHDSERRAYKAGWERYVKGVRGTSARPVKFATPLGMAAKAWAEAWFDGVATVRLERDDPAEIRDRYDRYLAYVFANKHGTWTNYNVEAVRAGMSPYFPKYGRSRRFHAEFIAAEAEAKAAHRGIWAPGAQAYPDYDEREAWWTARGDFVDAFRKTAEHDASYIDISHADATTRLEQLVGTSAVILGTVGDIRRGRPTRVTLEHFPLIFFDAKVLDASGIAAWQGELVTVSGTPSYYKQRLQLVVDRASQIQLSPVPGLVQP